MVHSFVAGSPNQEGFRRLFQRLLAQRAQRGCPVEECFGVVWEESLAQINLSENEHREMYDELIEWARGLRNSSRQKPSPNPCARARAAAGRHHG